MNTANSALTGWLVLGVSLLTAGPSAGAAEVRSRDLDTLASLLPHPSLSPGEVVRIQLEALGRNDDSGRGVEVAFRFASPDNKRSTGPLARFAQMFRGPVYGLMLDYVSADYEAAEVVGERARVRVTLAKPSRLISYVFYLSRQHQPPYEGCWMTDAVTVEQTGMRQAAARARAGPG